MNAITRAKRRTRAGIYLARVDRHRGWGRVNGYVGRSWNVPQRILCHQGKCGRHSNCHAKPWTVLLNVRFHWVRVPWWLSWKWSMAIMEAVAIMAALPLYNVQLNTKNPRRVKPSVAVLQAAARTAATRSGHRAPIRGRRTWRSLIQVLGAICIAVGAAMGVIGFLR